ncbi:Protein CBR-MADF-2- [Caenorhabditis briggsae]|uniref:Protein CBR-MADF-2 n=1 Tax=Caenorhabditis briggsae TaxID=6238 RepID=A8XXS4_CAEBR|nr:Protein CBR-MADF-2- [Caenorhabditis briggsae]CAP37443.2 Protein CBR-MADF-2- [Caenorhabditis briggsae]
MASWTDPTRQFLISAIRDRPVIWDKSYIGESSYRTMKVSSFEEVTQNLNSTYSTKFTWEDVRAQWKNLKDTFVRKLRWVHEGKYVEDAMKEPTWKFYRMLTFLDDKEAKRLGDACDHSYEMALTSQQQGNCSSGPIIGPRPQHCQQMSYEPTSSEEQMLQMFENKPPNNFQGPQGPQGPMMNSPQNLNSCSPASGMSSSSTSTMVTSSTGSKRDHRYSPVDNGNSNSGVDDELEEDDGQPDRKKMDFLRVQESLNANLNKCFTVEAIIAKWLEFVQLFRLKYAINGYSMADRENTYNKDGTVKDDNRESWRFFNRLECLIDPTDGLGPKKTVKQEIIED